MGAPSTARPLCSIAWGEADIFMIHTDQGLLQLHGRPFALLPGGTMFNAEQTVLGIAGTFDNSAEPEVYILGDDDPTLEVLLKYNVEIAESLAIAEQCLPR